MGAPLFGVCLLVFLIQHFLIISILINPLLSCCALSLRQTTPNRGPPLHQNPRGPPRACSGSLIWGAPLPFSKCLGGPPGGGPSPKALSFINLAVYPRCFKSECGGPQGGGPLGPPMGAPRGPHRVAPPVFAKGGASSPTRGASRRRQRGQREQQQSSSSSSNSSSSNGSSNREKDCLSLAGRVVACLPGGRFKVQLESAAAAAAAAAGLSPVFGDTLEAPLGLRDKMIMCSLSGKLRINRVYVHLHDFVVLQTNPLSPQEGRIVFRIKDNPAAAAADDDDAAAADAHH